MIYLKKLITVVTSIFLLTPILLPNISVLANENITMNTKTDEISSLKNDLSQPFVEVIGNDSVKLTYLDGSIDLLEKREDGIYRNNQLFLLLTSFELNHSYFRSANSDWVYVGGSEGRSDRNSQLKNIAAFIYGRLISMIGGPLVGTITGALMAILPSNHPGAYSRVRTYYNRSKRQFKIVTSYYENSNFSGYITTATEYLTVPAS